MSEQLSYNPEVLQFFIEDAAALWDSWWAQRQESTPDEYYIAQLKQRLKPNIKGVRLLREYAWEELEGLLDSSHGGEYFVGCMLSLEPFDFNRFKQIVDAGIESYVFWHALLDALIWSPSPEVKQLCSRMVTSGKPAHAALGYCALMAMDIQPSLSWNELIKAAQKQNNEVAIRGLCEYCSADATSTLITMLDQMEMSEKAVVLERLVKLGVPAASLPLGQFVYEPGPYRERLLKIVFRNLDADSADHLMRVLQSKPEPIRSCLIAVGAAKRRDLLPWVLQQMENLEHARIAGWAIEQILGIDLMELGWLNQSESLDEEWLNSPVDADLNWPDVELVRRGITNYVM
ncbi:hypothetical protein ONV78_26240 [Hahella sp. CR1]|uniref:hypothetical protein n=1 Tax=Hahella sp. CR1 TaxID=2992807 RepID=UPI0024426430|nr:hypothetical protein [Hahella sp. CR1]MDG9671261.1 hypothetical protein [Hahella sp. CR1]